VPYLKVIQRQKRKKGTLVVEEEAKEEGGNLALTGKREKAETALYFTREGHGTCSYLEQGRSFASSDVVVLQIF